MTIRLIDDEQRTWETRASYPVLLDAHGLVIGPYGWSHSEAVAHARGHTLAWDPGAIAAQLAPNGEVLVLPEGDTRSLEARKLLARLRQEERARGLLAMLGAVAPRAAADLD